MVGGSIIVAAPYICAPQHCLRLCAGFRIGAPPPAKIRERITILGHANVRIQENSHPSAVPQGLALLWVKCFLWPVEFLA